MLYGYSRVSLYNDTIKKTNEELDEEDVEMDILDEVMKELNHVKRAKRSTMITFYLSGGLLIVLSCLMLF